MHVEQCLLDMDGVIADFMGQLCKYHGRPSPYLDPANYGVWDTEILWGITVEEFWAPIKEDSLYFWRTILKTPEADKIVQYATQFFGEENVAILTAPSDDEGAVPGKRWWMKKLYPQFEKKMIFGSAKEFMAAPYRTLIDDRDKNVEGFRAAGGKAILVPRLWNSLHAQADYPLTWLLKGLKAQSDEKETKYGRT